MSNIKIGDVVLFGSKLYYLEGIHGNGSVYELRSATTGQKMFVASSGFEEELNNE